MLTSFPLDAARDGPDLNVTGKHATAMPRTAGDHGVADASVGERAPRKGPDSPLGHHRRVLGGRDDVTGASGKLLQDYPAYAHGLLKELVTIGTSGDAHLPTTEHQEWMDERLSSFNELRKD